jgi:hypothetical protein
MDVSGYESRLGQSIFPFSKKVQTSPGFFLSATSQCRAGNISEAQRDDGTTRAAVIGKDKG